MIYTARYNFMIKLIELSPFNEVISCRIELIMSDLCASSGNQK